MANLRDLGLSEYEARAYRALLRTGSTTAKELSQTSEVPVGRIYDVLSNLEQRDLVRSQAASRPKKYAAVEPDTALDRLLDERKRELEERAEQYEETVDELAAELDRQSAPAEEGFWTAAVGPEESVDMLVERLATADERIVIVAGSISPQFDIGDVGERVTDELTDAAGRGVDVSVLMSTDLVASLPETLGRRYADELVGQNGFEVRVTDEIEGTFNLIDFREVCIEVPNPLDPGETFALIDLTDSEFANDVRDVISPRWQEAERLDLDRDLGAGLDPDPDLG
ncbi:MAG: TrmB family transcriptional regulator [Haloferacaceae archaeon]